MRTLTAAIIRAMGAEGITKKRAAVMLSGAGIKASHETLERNIERGKQGRVELSKLLATIPAGLNPSATSCETIQS